MAKAKKAAKGAKKPATKAKKGATAKKSAAPKRKKKAIVALTTEERRKLLKLRADSDDVGERAATQWAVRKDVKVSELSPAKLRSLVDKARKAKQREDAVRAQMEAKVRPLQDARLLAEDAAYRAMLDLHAQVKTLGRKDPSVLEAFAFLAEHVGSTREGGREPEPAEEEKKG